MEVTLLGTGTGLADPNRYGSSSLVRTESERILVDCGNGALIRLKQAGVRPREISHVLITHQHYDHYCDLPYLAMESWIGEYSVSHGRFKVYGPKGLSKLASTFLEAYTPEIDSYMITQTRRDSRYLTEFDVHEVRAGWKEDFKSCHVLAGLADHGQIKIEVLAYRIETGSKSVVFSGDTIHCQGVIELARGADLLIHESTFLEEEVEQKRKSGFAGQIHSTPSDVGKVAQAASVKKVVLHHFLGWNPLGDDSIITDWKKLAPPRVKSHFDGEVIVGEDLMSFQV